MQRSWENKDSATSFKRVKFTNIQKNWTKEHIFFFQFDFFPRRASSPRWDDFYTTFIWNLISQFNQKVFYAAGKRLFDQVVFTIKSDVKPSCRTNAFILFNWHLKNKTKLIKENSIPSCQAGPLARVHIQNFHLVYK